MARPTLKLFDNLHIRTVDMYILLLLADPFHVSIAELRQNCSHLVFEARFLHILAACVDCKNRIRMIMKNSKTNCAV